MASQPKQTKPEPIDLAAIIAGTERRGGQPYKVALLLDTLPDEYRATLEDVLSNRVLDRRGRFPSDPPWERRDDHR